MATRRAVAGEHDPAHERVPDSPLADSNIENGGFVIATLRVEQRPAEMSGS